MKLVRSSVLTGICVAGLLYALLVLMDNASFPRWSNWRQMEDEGKWTEATVVRATPEDHGTCYFSYRVAGQVLGARASCGRYPVGARFPVMYLPSRPSFVSMKPPRSQWLGSAIGLGCFSLFAGSVVAVLRFRHGLRSSPNA